MWGFFGSPKLDLWPEASGLKSQFFGMITGLKFWRRSAFEKTSLSMGLMSFFPKFWWKERPILAQIRGPKDLSASRIYTILLGILHWGSTCTKTPEEQSGGLCFRGNWRWSPNGAAYDVKWHFPVCVLVYYIMFRFHACIYIYIHMYVPSPGCQCLRGRSHAWNAHAPCQSSFSHCKSIPT